MSITQNRPLVCFPATVMVYVSPTKPICCAAGLSDWTRTKPRLRSSAGSGANSDVVSDMRFLLVLAVGLPNEFCPDERSGSSKREDDLADRIPMVASSISLPDSRESRYGQPAERDYSFHIAAV